MTGAADRQARVGDVWAAEWHRTDRSFADLSRHLDAAILTAIPDGRHVLDIGCGAGATSLALAAARPDVSVTGIDLSPALIDIARERAADSGLVRRPVFVLGAADRIAPDPIYATLVSRHGVMFFTDPVAAFKRLRTAAQPGAALIFSCFGARAQNRFATLADDLAGTSPAPVDGYAPGPFAFAEADQVAAILKAAGWRVDGAASVGFAYRVGQGADPVADAASFLSRIGPVSLVLRDAAPDKRAALLASLADRLATYRQDNVVDLPATAWIWRAQAGRGE